MPDELEKYLADELRYTEREALYKMFEHIGMRVQRLGGIIQNEMEVDPAMLKEWLDEVQTVTSELDVIVERTTAFLITGKPM